MKIKLLTTFVALIIGMLGLSTSANAQSPQEFTPEHLALARQYIDLTDKSQLYERAVLQMGIDTMQSIASQNPEIVDQVSDAVGATIETYVDDKDALFDQFARVYAIYFTQEELQVIVDFYSSDVGQKLAEQNPRAAQDVATVLQVFNNNLSTEFLAQVRSRLRDQGIEI